MKRRTSKKRSAPRARPLKETAVVVESRLTELETKMDFVSAQVSNHIPTSIAELKASLESIERKMGDVDAISRFVSVIMRGAVAVGTLVWAGVQIFDRISGGSSK